MISDDTVIEKCDVRCCTIPTDQSESDGTLEWSSTTIIIVRIEAGGRHGLGFTFSDAAAATLIRSTLAPLVLGRDAFAVQACLADMLCQTRNLGRPGLVASAISAVDVALWDLKARLLDLPLAKLFGAVRQSVPVYGSGGFTSYDDQTLCRQLEAFVESGITAVKMKVGRDPRQDRHRVRVARDAIGSEPLLMVDANGAHTPKLALAAAVAFADVGVQWYEEPVSSDDLEGLRFVRERAPQGMEITAGEYGYDPIYFRRMLDARSVDVLQCDATRCLGYSGFLKVGALCEAFGVPMSAHTAPHLHLHCCMAIPALRHIEYFHDHVRIVERLFDGVPSPIKGELAPDLSSAGHGLTLKPSEIDRYAS